MEHPARYVRERRRPILPYDNHVSGLLFRPLHGNRGGTVQPGWFLAEHLGPGDNPAVYYQQRVFSTPLVDFRLPACLHPNLNFVVTIGNQDAKWQPGQFTCTFPSTSVTTWQPVTSYYASPWNGGMLCKKVTIYPPTA